MKTSRSCVFLSCLALALVACGKSSPPSDVLDSSESSAIAWQRLDSAEAPVLSAEQALARFQLPEDLVIQAVATEPLIGDPVAMAWDENGRLYVAEMRSYMIDVEGSEENTPLGRIVVLTDDDQDGDYDNSHVFLDNLVLPRAVAVVNDGVLIGEPPNLLLCPNTKPLKCETPRRIGGYAENHSTANVEHLENGLMQGLDNWLYSARGERRLQVREGRLIEEPTVARGQWGITQDSQGRIFYNTNSNLVLGDWFPAEPFLFPYLEASDNLGVLEAISVDDQVWSARVNPGINRVTSPEALRTDGRLFRPTSASGVLVNRGQALGGHYSEHFFVPEPAGNLVAQLSPVSKGDFDIGTKHVTYEDETWGLRDFLTSTDERFRPVDAKLGPDGALYIIDMYRGVIQHAAFLSDELKQQIAQRQLEAPIGLGRIWRIASKDAPLEAIQPMGDLSDAQLVAELKSDNGWRRDTAQRLLLVRPTAPGLIDVLNGSNAVAARHAVWALHGRGEDLTKFYSAALENLRVPILRAQGARFAPTTLIKELQNSTSAVLQRELLLAMRWHSGDPKVQTAIADFVALRADTKVLQDAAVAAALNNETKVLTTLIAKAASPRLEVITRLTRRAYLSARETIDDAEVDNPKLLALLALIEGAAEMEANGSAIQVAMFKGLANVVSLPGFKAAQLSQPAPLFKPSEANGEYAKAQLEAHRTFTWPGDTLVLGVEPLTIAQKALMAKGEVFYANCASCHGDQGQGITGLAPPLAGAEWVTGPQEWLARIILQGMTGPIEVAGKPWNGNMPPHQQRADLDDETLAGLMTFLRRSWGNTASAVSIEQVLAVRKATQKRKTPWTASELKTVPYDRGYGLYTGKYKVAFVTMTVYQEDGTLKMKVPLYGGGELVPEEEKHVFSGSDGEQSARLRFVVQASGQVSELVLTRDGSDITFKRVE